MTMQGGRRPPRPRNYYNNNNNSYHSEPSAQYGPSNSHTGYSNGYNSSSNGGGVDYRHGMTYYESPAGMPGMRARYRPEPPVQTTCNNNNSTSTAILPQDSIRTSVTATRMSAGTHAYYNNNTHGSAACMPQYSAVTQEAPPQQQQSTSAPYMWQTGRHEAMTPSSGCVWPTTTIATAPMSMMYNGRDDNYGSHASGRGRKAMMSRPTTTHADEAAATTTTAFAGQHISYYNSYGVDASQAASHIPPYATTTTMNVTSGAGAVRNTAMMQPTSTEGNMSQKAVHIPAEGHYLREVNAESSTHYNNNNSKMNMAQDSSTLMPFQVRDTSRTAVTVEYADHSSTSEALAQPALSMTTDTRTSLSTSTESNNNNTRNGSITRPVRGSTNNSKHNNNRSTRGVQPRDSTITCTAKDSHIMCEAKDNNGGSSTGDTTHRNAVPQHKGRMSARPQTTPFAVPYDARTAQPAEMTWYSIPPQHKDNNATTAASMAQLSERGEGAAVDMSACCVGQEEYVIIRPHVLQMLLRQQQQQQSSNHHHSPSSPFPGPPPNTLYIGPSYYDNNNAIVSHAPDAEMTSAIQQHHSYGAAFIEGSTAYATEYMDMQAQNSVYTTNHTPSIAHHAPLHTMNTTTTSVSPQQQYQSASMAPVAQFTPSLPHERSATDLMNEAMHWSQASASMPPPPPQSSQPVQRPYSTTRYPEDNTTQAGGKVQHCTLTTTTTTANVTAGRSHHERDSTCNAHADIRAAQSPIMLSSSTGAVPLTQNRTACPAMPSSSLSAVTRGIDNTREPTVAATMHTPLHMPDDEQTTRRNTTTTIMEEQSGMSEAEVELQQQLVALQFHAMTDTSSSTPHSLLNVSSPITTRTTTRGNAAVHSSHAGKTAKSSTGRHHAALQPHTQGTAAQPADVVAATSRPATMSSATTTMTSSCLRPTQSSNHSSNPYIDESNCNNVHISSSGTRGGTGGGGSHHRVHMSNTSGSNNNNNSQHCSVAKGSVTAASHTGAVQVMPSTAATLQPSAMAMTTTTHSLITAAQPMQSSSSFSSSSPATAGAGSSSSLQLLRQPHQSNGVPQRLSSGSTSHIRSVGGASGSLPRHFFPFSSSHSASSHPITAQAPPSHALHHHHNSSNTALHLSSVQEPAVQKAINGTRYTIGGWYEGVVKRYNPLRGFGFVTGKFMLHYDPQHCERVCLRSASAILAQQEQHEEEEAKAACNDEQQQQSSSDDSSEEGTGQSNTRVIDGSDMERNNMSDKAGSDKRTPPLHDKDVVAVAEGNDDDVRAKAQARVSNSNTTPNASMSSDAAATTTVRSATHPSHASATPPQDTLTTTTNMNAVMLGVSVAAASNNGVIVKEGEAAVGGSNTEEEAERADGMVVLSTMQWYLAHTDLEGNKMSSDVHAKEEDGDEEKNEVHETTRRRSAGLQRTPIDIGDIFVHHSCISLSGFRVLPVNTVVRFSVAVLMNTVQAVDVIPLGPQWPLPSLPPSACPSPPLQLLTGKQTQQRQQQQLPPPCVQPSCTTSTTTTCMASCMSEPPAYVLPEAAAMVWRHHRHHSHHSSNTHSSSSSTHDSGNEGSSSSSGASVCEKGLSWAEMAVVPSAAVPNALEAKSTMHVVHLVKNTPSESGLQPASASPQAATHIVTHRNATSDGCDNNNTRGQTKGRMSQRVSVHPTHITQGTSATSTDGPVTLSHHGSLRLVSQQPAVMPDRAEQQQQQQEGQYGEGMMPTQHVTTITTTTTTTASSASDAHAVQAAVRTTWAMPASARPTQDPMTALPHDTQRNVVHPFSSSSFPSSSHPQLQLHEGQTCVGDAMTCEKEDEASPSRLPFSTAIHARVGTQKATTTTAVDATQHTSPHTEDTTHAATQPPTTTVKAAKTDTHTTLAAAVVMTTTTKGLHGGARTGNGEERGGTNTTTTMQGGASSSAPQDNSRSGTKPHHTHTTTTTTTITTMSASQYPMKEEAGTHVMATSKTVTTRHGDLQADGGSAEVQLETGSEHYGRDDEDGSRSEDSNADNRSGCRCGGEETSGAVVRCVMSPQAASQPHYHSSRGEGNAAEQEIRHAIHIPSDTHAMTAVTQPVGNDTHLHHLQQQQRRDVRHEGEHDRRGPAPVTSTTTTTTTTTTTAVHSLQVAPSVEATGTLSQPVTPCHRVPPSAHGPLHTTQSEEDTDKKAEKGWNEQQSRVPLPSSSPTTTPSSSSSSSSAPASISPVDSIKAALLRFVTPLMQPRPTATTTTDTPTDPEYLHDMNEAEEDRIPVDVTQQQRGGDVDGNGVADDAAASSSSPVRRTRPVSEEDNDNDEVEGEGSPTEMASVSNGSGTHTSGETQLGSNPNSSPDWTEVFDQKIANERMKDMLFHKQALKSFPQYNNNDNDNSSSKGNDEAAAAVWEVRVGEGAVEQQPAASFSRPHEGRVYTHQQQQPHTRRVPQRVQDVTVTTTTATTVKEQAVRRKERAAAVKGQTDTPRSGDRKRSEGRGQHTGQSLPSHTQGNPAPQPSFASSSAAVPHSACKPVPNTTTTMRPAKETQHVSGTRKTAGANTASPTKADEATHLPSSLASPWLQQQQQRQSYGVIGAEGHETQPVPKRTRTKTHTTDVITTAIHVVPSHSDPHMRNAATRPTTVAANTTTHASPPCHHDTNSQATSPAVDMHTDTPITGGSVTSHHMCAVDDAMASLCVIAVHRLPPSLAAQVPAGVGCIALPRATVEALGLLSHDNTNSNSSSGSVGERNAHAVRVRPTTTAANDGQEWQRVKETQASHGAVRDTTPVSVTRVALSSPLPMAEDNTRTAHAMGDKGDDTAVVARMQDNDLCEEHKGSQDEEGNTQHENNNNNAMRSTVDDGVPVDEAVTTTCSDALAATVAVKDHTPPLVSSSQGSSPDMLLFLSPTQKQQKESSSGGGMWAEANTQSSSHTCSHHPQMRFTSSASGESEQDDIHPL